jgi:predicted porin
VAAVAYDYTKGYSVSNEKINQAVLGLDYFLSKRTDLYVVGFFQHVLGENSLGQEATAQITSLASSSQNRVAALIGMRTRF